MFHHGVIAVIEIILSSILILKSNSKKLTQGKKFTLCQTLTL